MSNLYEKETLLFSFCYDQGYQHNNNYNCQKYYTQHFAGCLLMFLTLKRKESEKDLSFVQLSEDLKWEEQFKEHYKIR